MVGWNCYANVINHHTSKSSLIYTYMLYTMCAAVAAQWTTSLALSQLTHNKINNTKTYLHRNSCFAELVKCVASLYALFQIQTRSRSARSFSQNQQVHKHLLLSTCVANSSSQASPLVLFILFHQKLDGVYSRRHGTIASQSPVCWQIFLHPWVLTNHFSDISLSICDSIEGHRRSDTRLKTIISLQIQTGRMVSVSFCLKNAN